MEPPISSRLLGQIIADAAASPQVEICGLLLGRQNRVEEVRRCRNVAAQPASEFEIEPAALLAAHRQSRSGGPEILGCYHSHPSGSAEPSAHDAAAAEPNGWWWVIVAGGQARLWRARPNGRWRGRFDEVAPVTVAALPARVTVAALPAAG